MALKLSFVVDILALYLLGDFLGYFLKKCGNFFFKPSCHPDQSFRKNNFQCKYHFKKYNGLP
jgi:hypothetical protein